MASTIAGVEVGQVEEVEEVEPMDTEDEEEGDDSMGVDAASAPEGEETATPGDRTALTHEVRFDANHHTQSNMVQGDERTALRPFGDSATAVGQLLRLKKGANPAEIIQFVAHAKLNHTVITSARAMDALRVVETRAEGAHRQIALAAIAGKKAADKKVAAKARARKALEAANTKLKELVATLEGKEPDDEQKAAIDAAKKKIAACALKLQRI